MSHVALSGSLIAITASSFVASAALAAPDNVRAGGNGPAQVKDVKLALSGIRVPDVNR